MFVLTSIFRIHVGDEDYSAFEYLLSKWGWFYYTPGFCISVSMEEMMIALFDFMILYLNLFILELVRYRWQWLYFILSSSHHFCCHHCKHETHCFVIRNGCCSHSLWQNNTYYSNHLWQQNKIKVIDA